MIIYNSFALIRISLLLFVNVKYRNLSSTGSEVCELLVSYGVLTSLVALLQKVSMKYALYIVLYMLERRSL